MSNEILSKALELAPAERYRLAFLIAESLGYALENNIELRKELEMSRDLRAKLEVQSMQAMDRLRAQIRGLGAEPVL